MDKLTKFLEQYVEWVVLALGGLYVLYMAYAYWLTPPAPGSIGGRVLNPGEIDSVILDGPAQALSEAMNEPARQRIEVPPFTASTLRNMSGETVEAFAMNEKIAWRVQPLELRTGGDDTQQVAQGQLAKAVPTPPIATFDTYSSGYSLVQKPIDEANWDRQPQPQDMEEVDTAWVSLVWHVDPAEITAAFQAVNVPQESFSTMFLSVEVERREVRNGQPIGQPAKVRPLPISRKMPMPDFAQINDEMLRGQQEAIYQDWASKNTPIILTPDFYTVIGGDPWYMPGEEPELDARPAGGAGPGTPVAPRRVMTPEERRAQQEAERQRREMERQRREAERRAPRGNISRTPGRASFAKREVPASPLFDDNYQPAPGEMPANPMPFPAPGQNPQMNANLAANGQPLGMFDSRQIRNAIAILAHDDGVQPGRTYQYRIRYALRNPLYLTNLIADIAAQNQLVTWSQWSEWSESITLPPLTELFVASGINPRSGAISFEVFTRHAGRVVSKNYEVLPGDTIGSVDSEGVNFRTDWTLVDIRRQIGGDGEYVLLLTPEGTIERRTFRADRDSAKRRQLLEAVQAGRAEQAAVR